MVRTIKVKFDTVNDNISRMMDFEKGILRLNNNSNELCTGRENGFMSDLDVVVIYLVSDLGTIKAINAAIKQFDGKKIYDQTI